LNQDRAFAISIGLVDGLITSLMITAYAIVYHYPISSIQSLHIAFGSSFVGAISYFIAEFSKLSQNEFRVSKALKPGIKVPPSVKRNLRERNLRESMYGGSASLIMGFVGASIPLFSYTTFQDSAFLSLGLSYLTLALFGTYTSKRSGGSYTKWILGLVALGVLMTLVGAMLRIVS